MMTRFAAIRLGSMGQVDADDRREKLRGQSDRKCEREEEGFQHRTRQIRR